MNLDKMYLCMVKNKKCYFTDNMEKQWGDDWDDKPYEHNAEPPYDDETEVFKIYLDVGSNSVSEPCDGFTNSPYSVDQINSSVKCKSKNSWIPWLTIGDTKIYPYMSYKQFKKSVEELGCEIYTKDIELL